MLSVASAKDWDVCGHYDWPASPDAALAEDWLCVGLVTTSSALALTARPIVKSGERAGGAASAVAVGNCGGKASLNSSRRSVGHQHDAAFVRVSRPSPRSPRITAAVAVVGAW